VWGRNTHPYFTAYAIVSITWLFLALFVAITVTVHTHGSDFYETPVGVSFLSPVFQIVLNLFLFP
jgi:hypothetical protein